MNGINVTYLFDLGSSDRVVEALVVEDVFLASSGSTLLSALYTVRQNFILPWPLTHSAAC